MNKILKQFVPKQQGRVLDALLIDSEEKDFFKDMLEKLTTHIEKMPKSYEQDGLGDNAVVHLHYFYGSSDWWIIEKDTDDEQHQAFGFVRLNGMTHCAELGYISINELVGLGVGVELDLYWEPKTLGEIKKNL